MRLAGRPVRVLVVDDYPDNAESMAMLLRLHGHEVDVALEGAAALRAARARPPDVALLDIAMPGMSGYDLARHLRRMFGGTLLLIAISAYDFEMDRQRSRDAGFDLHFAKPADPAEVEKRVRGIGTR